MNRQKNKWMDRIHMLGVLGFLCVALLYSPLPCCMLQEVNLLCPLALGWAGSTGRRAEVPVYFFPCFLTTRL
jgi:hypothetical protein